MLHWFHIKRSAQIDNIYDKVLEKLRWTKRIVENKTFVLVHIGWKPEVQQKEIKSWICHTRAAPQNVVKSSVVVWKCAGSTGEIKHSISRNVL